MTTQKVSVTIDEAALARARALAGPRGLSSYLEDALVERLERDERRRQLLAHLDELDAADPASDATREKAAARAARIRRSTS
jgi:hypothetical protein